MVRPQIVLVKLALVGEEAVLLAFLQAGVEAKDDAGLVVGAAPDGVLVAGGLLEGPSGRQGHEEKQGGQHGAVQAGLVTSASAPGHCV